jgi:hypothetical protein
MKLLLGFMVMCLLLGTIKEGQPAKQYLLPIVGMSIVLAIGYFVFRQS